MGFRSIDRSWDDSGALGIAVVFTSVSATLAALRTAAALVPALNAQITIVAFQIVPFPAALTTPPVDVEWGEERLREIAAQSRVATTVRYYLCRNRVEVLLRLLKPRSIVVLGRPARRWWRTGEERLARILAQAGHEVILAPA